MPDYPPTDPVPNRSSFELREARKRVDAELAAQGIPLKRIGARPDPMRLMEERGRRAAAQTHEEEEDEAE